MKRLLLDTHVLLWFIDNGNKHIGPQTLKLICDRANKVFVSAASSWEIAIKKSLGKLNAPDDIDRIVEEKHFSKLAITLLHGDKAGALPVQHNDPFDRMLITQAQVEGLKLVTADEKIKQYNIAYIDPTK